LPLKQVFIRVEARADELNVKTPSHMTVYRILQPIIDRQEKAKSIRSPGWQGERLSVKTRDGLDLTIEHSNQVWQCDHTPADVLLVDSEGKLLGRPWLTTVIDSYSRCIVGINLGFDAPSSQVVSLALHHAILPKQYVVEYGLQEQWGTYGLPKHFYTDGGKDFRSDHLKQVGIQLGFPCHLRDRPSEGVSVERPFGTLNTELFSLLPGYTGSNVQKRPETAEADACLTLRELERRIVRYLVDNYNQRLDARMGDQTRFQRWESGLIVMPKLLSERELDICLMKQARRQIQRGGYLQFENLMYRGDNLAGYGGESVVVRFDPRDITTILIYLQIPQECVAKELFGVILGHLKYQVTKGTIAEMRDRTLKAMKGCQVEMLIIDEADRFKPKTFAEVRDIFDNLQISVILVGTDRLDTVIKRDEQVYNRFRACYRFGKLSGEDFERTVKIWEQQVLRLPTPSNLTGKTMIKTLGEATGGYIGLMDMILREAAIRSLKKGLTKIDLKTLKEVIEEYK
jgi:transposase InsO family protein